jgi:DNA-binding transcriptional ArsR family regulator
MATSAISGRTLDRVFAALADPTRRAIVDRLSRGNASISELAQPFRMSLPAVSKHLRVLEGAGLMSRQKVGRTHHCALIAAPLRDAQDFIDRYRAFWSTQLDRLAAFVEQPPTPAKPSARRRSASRPHGTSRKPRGR